MHLRQLAFPERARRAAADCLGQRRLPDFAGPDLPFIGKAVYGLGLVREYGYSARRRQFAYNLDNQIGADADNILRLVYDQVLDAFEIFGDILILPDEVEHSLDILFVGAEYFRRFVETRMNRPRVRIERCDLDRIKRPTRLPDRRRSGRESPARLCA